MLPLEHSIFDAAPDLFAGAHHQGTIFSNFFWRHRATTLQSWQELSDKPGDADLADSTTRLDLDRGLQFRCLAQPAGDGGVSPDEPDEGEFELIGDNDLGAADLGPAAPNATDPDSGSGRVRKIT